MPAPAQRISREQEMRWGKKSLEELEQGLAGRRNYLQRTAGVGSSLRHHLLPTWPTPAPEEGLAPQNEAGSLTATWDWPF